MFKISPYALFLASLSIMSTAIASTPISVTYDFSKVIVIASKNTDWNHYKNWYLGYQSQVANYVPGWVGEPIKNLTSGSFVSKNATDSASSIKTLALGLTSDYGVTFTVAPANCLVTLKDGDVLHISGTIYVPGENKDPYFKNVRCKLN